MGQDRRTFVAFDQYQRYETISRIINYYRGQKSSKVFRILELGANEHKDMRLFLPDDEILFTDIVLTETMKNDPDFQQADGTALPFEDKSFDFVFAADVLEHIPNQKRERFLSEACRVAEKCAILSFPFQSSDVVDAEMRVNSYYKAISGQNFIWLYEHSINGLPKTEEIENILNQLNCCYFSFTHGDIKTWEKMWYCVFDAIFAPETLEYHENIDHYYNCNLYIGDISESCYRAYYVISEEELSGLNQYISGMWVQSVHEKIEFLKILFQAHKHIHPLFMQDRMHRELTDKEVHIQNLTAIHDAAQAQWAAQEEQYRQRQRADAEALADKEVHIQNLTAMYDASEKQWAAREEQYQQRQRSDADTLAEKETQLRQYEQQREADSQKLAEQEQQLERYRVQRESDVRILAQAEQQCAEIGKELAHYQQHYHAAINQREELKQQLAQAQYAYKVISNAFFWKITKPFRAALDMVKSLMKRNRYTHLLGKGLKCWKENGFAYTWKKVQDRRHHRQDFEKAKQPLFTLKELEQQEKDVFQKNIKFSVLVPLYNTPERFLHEMIQSVLDQTYGNWELCMADGSDRQHKEVERICKSYMRKDSRVQYKKLEQNLGISENTNACIEMATGDYIALLDHDDLLHPAALHEVMKAICEQSADFIYTDENTFHEKPEDAYCPHFKPDFAPDTLRSYNYICHLTVFQRALIEQLGEAFRAKCDGSQDYDLVLRLTEKAEHIVHIPEILYYWRSHGISVASDITAKPYTIMAAKLALTEHLERIGLNGVILDARIPSTYRIAYEIKDTPLVSIIIPNKDHVDDLRKCIESIQTKSTYSNWEIVIVENNSVERETFDYYEELQRDRRIQVVFWEGPFNYSAINNFGMEYTQGTHLLLLNNDVEIITADWIEEMLMFSQRNDVGAVGAMLYYPDETVQHAGVILGIGGVGGHAHKYFRRGDNGYMSRMAIVQNYTAVTAACMMIRREVWDTVNGLDESFAVAFNDVDLCMRIRRAGYLIVWTPYAELYHYESRSRGLEDTPEKQRRFSEEVRRFQTRWAKELEKGDPYYNPNFTLDREDFSLR